MNNIIVFHTYFQGHIMFSKNFNAYVIPWEWYIWRILNLVIWQKPQIEECLVRQIGQGLLKIFIQCPLEKSPSGDYSLGNEEYQATKLK